MFMLNSYGVIQASVFLTLCMFLYITNAAASNVGILGLFQMQKGADISKNLHFPENCQLLRHGMIGGEAGDIDLDQPNQFALIKCDETPIAAVKVFDPIVDNSDSYALLEGDISLFPEDNSASLVADRSYILKISHYNNKTPVKRSADLKALRQESLGLSDRYRREAFIAVTSATGMETPDEVALLFYDNAKEGEHFRENNPDFLEKIGKFNEEHLNDHIYYFGIATK